MKKQPPFPCTATLRILGSRNAPCQWHATVLAAAWGANDFAITAEVIAKQTDAVSMVSKTYDNAPVAHRGAAKGLLDLLSGTKRPAAGTPVCCPEELRNRPLGLNRDTAPWRVVDGAAAGVDLVAEWKIVDAQWYKIFAKAGLSRAFTILLRLDAERREVRAQDQAARVEWEAGVPTLSFSRQWSRGQTWSFSASTAYGFTETLAPGQIYRYRFATEEIKGPIQQTVTDCGWAYVGVVFGNP